MALRRCYSANRVKPGGQQLSLFSAHCAAQSLQFFARAPEGQMWPGSRCLDVHRQIVETEWSDACEWCMGAGQCTCGRTERRKDSVAEPPLSCLNCPLISF